MIINTSSIKDISKSFKPLATSFNDINYVVNFEAKIFDFRGDDNFTVNDLKVIFSEADREIDGEIRKTSLDTVLQDIKSDLSYCATSENIGNEPLAYYRKKAFMMIVEEYFPYNPSTIYKHFPSPESYFDLGIMWHFCYIFLENGKGIILSGGAFD